MDSREFCGGCADVCVFLCGCTNHLPSVQDRGDDNKSIFRRSSVLPLFGRLLESAGRAEVETEEIVAFRYTWIERVFPFLF